MDYEAPRGARRTVSVSHPPCDCTLLLFMLTSAYLYTYHDVITFPGLQAALFGINRHKVPQGRVCRALAANRTCVRRHPALLVYIYLSILC